MPLPASSDLHVNGLLTETSIAYQQDASDFIADTIFPSVPVKKQSDKFAKYTKDFWFKSQMEKRAPATESAEGDYGVDTSGTYFSDVWALHKDIGEQDRANADDVFEPDNDATSYLTQQYLLARDKDWVTNFFTTSIWDSDQTGVGAGPGANQFLRWNVTGSTPFLDIRKQMFDMKSKTGLMPNVLTLGSLVWQILADHVDLLDRIKGGATANTPANVMQQLVAQVLGLDKVVVAGAIENTANENATGVFGFVAGKHALLTYSAKSPGKRTPSAGYTFMWNGLAGMSGGRRILKMPVPLKNADRIEIEATWANKVVASDLGRFFATAVA